MSIAPPPIIGGGYVPTVLLDLVRQLNESSRRERLRVRLDDLATIVHDVKLVLDARETRSLQPVARVRLGSERAIAFSPSRTRS